MNDLLELAKRHPSIVAFYTSVGRLIIRFADIETCLSAFLRFNLSWKIDTRRASNTHGYAAAMLGSMRFKASKDTAKRLVVEEGVLNEAQIAALNEVFEQIAHIANLRDKLAHQHMTPHPDNADCTLISDSHSTRKLSANQTWQVDIADIDHAADDLLVSRKWFGNPTQSGTLFKKIPTEPPTWRYRPSALKLLDPEIARALRARKNLPPTSDD